MGRDDRGRHGTFRIWVRGTLDESFSDGLAGINQESVSAETMLYGEMVDQSQVHSTLDLLRSLGIEVVRFEVDTPRHPTTPHSSTAGPGERDGVMTGDRG